MTRLTRDSTQPTHDSTPLSHRAAPLTRIEHLSITFPGRERPAVDDLSLEVHAGECVALVGESGSGKSLTARALLGLVPATASLRGTVFLGEDHAPPNGHPSWAALRGVRSALVPQDALGGLDPLRRLEHEVGDALRLHRILPRGEARRARTIDALAAAGMPTPEQQLRRRSDELSGGLRQRALVASALIAEPELIVADEPTTALDVSIQAQIIGLLKKVCRERGAAVMLITHDMGVIAETCDRVAVMYAGRIAEIGPVHEVINQPAHPYTEGLMAAIPDMALDREQLNQIDGAMPRLNAIPRGCAFNPRCPQVFDRCRVERPDLMDAGATRAACWLHAPGAATTAGAQGATA